MKKFLSLLLVAFASVAFAGDDEVIRDGTWFAIVKGKYAVFFYDPYQTRQNADGIIESVVYGRHMLDGSVIKPAYIKVNCDKRTIQNYAVAPDNSPQLAVDWHVPREKSVGDEWVKTLCGFTTESGIKIAFIGYMENPYNKDRATHIYWLPEIEHSPSVPGGKTYQMVYYVENDNRGYDGFIYLDCEKNLYSTATFLGLDLLTWEANPPLESVAGYLMFKACGKRTQ